MGWSEALAELGLSDVPDEITVRSAFRSRLRATHPDLNGAGDATEATVRLTTAYRVVLAGLSAPAQDPAPPRPPAPDPEPESVAEPQVRLVDSETVAIEAPAIEVIPLLVEVAHRLGDVTYLDPASGLIEIVAEFIGAPTSSIVLSLQGRATGWSEVFCSVEPLSGGEAPSAEAVTQLLWRTLRGADPTA